MGCRSPRAAPVYLSILPCQFWSLKIMSVMFPVDSRFVSASRCSRPKSDPWQQHDRLELPQQRFLPALWPAARNTGIWWLVSRESGHRRLSAGRHGSTVRCLRSSNAGGCPIIYSDAQRMVQAVCVTWRGHLVVLSGEQRDQGNCERQDQFSL